LFNIQLAKDKHAPKPLAVSEGLSFHCRGQNFKYAHWSYQYVSQSYLKIAAKPESFAGRLCSTFDGLLFFQNQKEKTQYLYASD